MNDCSKIVYKLNNKLQYRTIHNTSYSIETHAVDGTFLN